MQVTETLVRCESPLGPLVVRLAGDRLRALSFAGSGSDLSAGVAGQSRRAALDPAPAWLADLLAAWFAGLSPLPPFTVDLAGTAFQRAVWEATRGIPRGSVHTYASLAALIGRPRAVRAVGTALGANPLLLLVPCHRVIGSDGRLCGYAGGLERKAALLELEGLRPGLRGAA